MKRTHRLLLALAVLLAASRPAWPQEPAPPPAEPEHRLSVSLLTAEFLARLAAMVEAARIEDERAGSAYLQEKLPLIWTRDDGGRDFDWYAAAEHCDELELGAWDDWRLPTIEELEALHDRRSIDLFKLPGEFRLTACCPWSRTPSVEGSAWSFSFLHRKRFSGDLGYSFQLRALCVRPASAADQEFYARVEEEAKEAAKLARRGS